MFHFSRVYNSHRTVRYLHGSKRLVPVHFPILYLYFYTVFESNYTFFWFFGSYKFVYWGSLRFGVFPHGPPAPPHRSAWPVPVCGSRLRRRYLNLQHHPVLHCPQQLLGQGVAPQSPFFLFSGGSQAPPSTPHGASGVSLAIGCHQACFYWLYFSLYFYRYFLDCFPLGDLSPSVTLSGVMVPPELSALIPPPPGGGGG